MAFREETFGQSLDQLNQGSGAFLSGLVVAAQGDLLKKQSVATQQIISGFSKKLQELESTPLTTEEQLTRMNQDPDIKDSMTNLQSMIGDYQALTQSVFERQRMVNKIYGDTLNALAGVGGEQAERLTKTLAAEHGLKTKELEELGQLPFKSLEYKSMLISMENARANTQMNLVKLDELRQDVDAQRLFRDMIDSKEFTDMNLVLNQATGGRGYNLSNFRDKMWLKYKDDPRFERAWTGVEEYIRKNVEKYRPEFRDVSGGFGSGAYMDNLLRMKMLYNDLKEVAGKVGTYQNDPKYKYLRDEYDIAVKELRGDPDPNKKPNELWRYNFGADPEVVAQLEGDTKETAEYVYKMFYDKTNQGSYWNHLDMLSKGLYQPMGVSGYTGNLRVLDPSDPSGAFIFDISKLITNAQGKGGGWWNPYEKQKSVKESQQPFAENIKTK